MTTDLVFGPRIPLYRCVHTDDSERWPGTAPGQRCGAEIRYDGHGTGWHHAAPYYYPKHHAVAPPGAHPDLPPPEE